MSEATKPRTPCMYGHIGQQLVSKGKKLTQMTVTEDEQEVIEDTRRNKRGGHRAQTDDSPRIRPLFGR